jgi:hypothetical protein
MFNSSKSPLRSFAAAFGFGGMQNDEDEAERDESRETDPKVSRLRRVLADLKAGEPQAEVPAVQAPAPQASPTPVATEAPRAEPVAAQVPPPTQPVPVQTAPPTIDTARVVSAAKAETAAIPTQTGETKVETPMPKDPKPAVNGPVLNGPAINGPVVNGPVVNTVAAGAPPANASVANAAAANAAPGANGETLSTAQNLVAEQRRVVESLLIEVRALEDRLNTEVTAAQADETYKAAKEKVARLAHLEQQANEVLHAAAARHDAALTERKETERLAVAARTEADGAQARVTGLEQQLKEAQLTAAQAVSLATQRESKAKECGEKETTAQRELVDATDRATACRADSTAAATEASALKEAADNLKNQLPTTAPNLAGVNDVQALASRIAQHATALAAKDTPAPSAKVTIGGA